MTKQKWRKVLKKLLHFNLDKREVLENRKKKLPGLHQFHSLAREKGENTKFNLNYSCKEVISQFSLFYVCVRVTDAKKCGF